MATEATEEDTVALMVGTVTVAGWEAVAAWEWLEE